MISNVSFVALPFSWREDHAKNRVCHESLGTEMRMSCLSIHDDRIETREAAHLWAKMPAKRLAGDGMQLLPGIRAKPSGRGQYLAVLC